ncbi:sulfur carrier protein ThiS [Microbulbifer thermotolerans]|uniref:Sulfur carrier protein ThiS n=1 Tax=Microbulbifer thermotolerans TaxID=252514 RepID=A0A143HMA9_MICTH|nr:sulfur carrier protein ThiS [Microbulbifer thermotolerans]AMX02855.1 thiamine biosynthesis protein ThiS [Microbulbifer thermotolerans]MCX2781175.1 sulfur carrier protein ThiS [Microbulbifer thermotolerans]MCX2784464.1 sulfur carrier protein ThiS [Microbulbifer thermotolerans]MCX2796331.1 sulfur carrier protein ThiS [Microbulbifer thermotolerans]MCX2803148.1 sulfur carrier protein ThiS [Microbulbifer thermotolerans]
MRIFVNGEARIVEGSPDLASLLQQMEYSGETFAVAVNGDFVPRSEYPRTQIQDGDTLDVVAPVVGG